MYHVANRLPLIELLEPRLLLSDNGTPFAIPEIQGAPGGWPQTYDLPPAAYDLRDEGRVTDVKDQVVDGPCWAFATIASLESARITEVADDTDLSEDHLENFHGFDLPVIGGNSFMSEAYLSRGSGPVTEAEDPYQWEYDFWGSPNMASQFYTREMLRLGGHLDEAVPSVVEG